MAKLVAIGGGGMFVDVENISVVMRLTEYDKGKQKIINLYTLKHDNHFNNLKSTFENRLDADNELKYIMEAKGLIEPSAALMAEIEKTIKEAKKG